MDVLLHSMLRPVTISVAAGVLCLLIPDRWERVRAGLAFCVSLVTLALSWPLFQSARASAPPTLQAGWWTLRLDPLGGFVLLSIAVFGVLIALYSLAYMKGRSGLREYYACFLWTLGLSYAVVMANELTLLLVLWGLLGVTLYLLIGTGGPDAAGAAKKTLIVVGGSDCLLLLGILLYNALTGTTRLDAEPLPLTGKLSHVAFLCFAIAAFAKAGAMPCHTWVPDCGEKAPVAVTAFLPASLDKLLGIYLLVRTTNGLFELNAWMRGFLLLVGAMTVICAVMMALVQHDLKRLLSYHAVSQVGYMVLGIGTGSPVGIAGGLFHMLNNALYKTALFLDAGAAEKTAGTTDLDRLGGLARAMPLTFGSCVVAAMAISGIPPLNGFTSKWMVYQGLADLAQEGDVLWPVWLTVAMLGSALTLASFVKVLHAVFLCKPPPDAGWKPRETPVSMWLPAVILAGLCVLFGVLAGRLPLRMLIVPATVGLPGVPGPVAFSGAWRAAPATLMLLIGYGLGLLVYWLSAASRSRVCPTYIGGEDMSRTHISGVPTGRPVSVEVTGVDFYRTVAELFPLRGIYWLAEHKVFDLYEVGRGIGFAVSWILQRFHTGVLNHYTVWYIIGLVIVYWTVRRYA